MGAHSDVPCRLLNCRHCLTAANSETLGAAAMLPSAPELFYSDVPSDPDDWFHFFVNGGASGVRVETVAPWRERRSSARRSDPNGNPAASRSDGVRRRGPGRRWEDRGSSLAMY